jgi:hypothetical protein
VQAFPSSQAAALFAKTQPVAGLQLSVVQRLPSSHTTGVVAHEPFTHVSPTVQAFESEQAAVLFVYTHPVAGSQLSLVHTLLSLQFTAVPGRQAPNAQASPAVHASASSQTIVLFAKTQPVAGLQLSVVQRLPSSHASGVPTHAPPEQVSRLVHALESLHGFVVFAYTQPVNRSHVSAVHTLPSSHCASVEHAKRLAGARVSGGAIDIERSTVDSDPSTLTRSATWVRIQCLRGPTMRLRGYPRLKLAVTPVEINRAFGDRGGDPIASSGLSACGRWASVLPGSAERGR